MNGFTFETGKHYQVHKSYMWLGPVISVLAVVFIVALNSIPAIIQLISYLESHNGGAGILMGLGIGVLALLAAYGLVLLIYVLSYRNLSYVFDEGEFSLYSGIITKRRVHVPYARVQSVNHRASVIQRIAGVCTVSIDTAGGSGNMAVRVPYVTLDVAERMRTELFLRKALLEGTLPAGMPGVAAAAPVMTAGGVPAAAAAGVAPAATNVLDDAVGEVADWRGVFAGQVAGLEPASFEMGLTNKELLLTSVSHNTPIAVAFSIALTMLIVMLGMTSDPSLGISRFIAMAIVPITIASAVVSWLLGALGVAISYGNFRTRRRGSRVEVERGLLQRTFSGIDIERVQSIEIRQSFVRRLIGYCEVSLGRINSAQQDSSNNSSNASQRGLVIHPFVKIDQVDALLDQLLPEFADRPRDAQLMKLPNVAVRRALLRRCVWFNEALYIGLAMFVAYMIVRAVYMSQFPGVFDPFMQAFRTGTTFVLVVCVIATAFKAVGAVRWAQQSGFLWNPRYATVVNGGLSSTSITVPRQKIQVGSTRSNPFQRRLNLTSLQITTAAGSRSTTTVLLDVPNEAGDAWLTWLKPRR